MCVVELLDLPRSMWAGIAAMSVMLPFEKDSKVRTKVQEILSVVLYS